MVDFTKQDQILVIKYIHYIKILMHSNRMAEKFG